MILTFRLNRRPNEAFKRRRVEALVQSEMVLWWFRSVYRNTTWAIDKLIINVKQGVYLNLCDQVLSCIQYLLDEYATNTAHFLRLRV